MFNPKPIHRDSIPRALSKAERYRLLNEPFQAESICRDVLAIDPQNQEATICLILSLTDMFGGGEARVDEARALLPRLASAFDRSYYEGMVHERWARALLVTGYPPSTAYDLFRAAMLCFEQAQSHAEPGNDDAVLRWNACVRIMDRNHIRPAEVGAADDRESLDDDVPMR